MSKVAFKQASPFIKWAGGKGQLLQSLKELFPRKFEVYFEPFLGGGALFFYLASQGTIERATLSDANKELINCYVSIRDNLGPLLERLEELQARASDKEFFYKTARPGFNNISLETGVEGNVEKAVHDLVESVKKKNRDEFLDKLQTLLPDEQIVETSLGDATLRSGKGRRLAKLLLRILENAEGIEKKANKDLTLEHIWPVSKDNKLSDDSLCYQIGNMTLLMGVPNKKAQNYSYARKKRIYRKSKLHLNVRLLKKYKTWSEDAIIRRTQQISKDVVSPLNF